MTEPTPIAAARAGGGGDADWTRGAAKWAAVGVLGVASIAAFGWAVAGRSARVAQPPRAVQAAEPAAPAAPLPPTAAAPPKPTAPTVVININTATARQLELLPGVGPTIAARIVEQREARGPFKSVEQLDRVKGIGPALLRKIRPYCRVEDTAPARGG